MTAADATLLETLEHSRRMLDEAQRLTRIGSWEWDVASGVVTWTDELFRIYGYEPGAFAPTFDTFMTHLHPDDRAHVQARLSRSLEKRSRFEDVERVHGASGNLIVLRTEGEVITGADGTVLRMLGVCEDITDRHQAEEAAALLATIVETSNDAIHTVTAGGAITSWNPAAVRLFGYTEEEALQLDAARLIPDSRNEEDARLFARAFADRPVESFETLRVRKDGSQIAVSVAISPMRDVRGTIRSVSVISRDVSERRRFEQRLRYLSEHDALTGLHNRDRFEAELERAVEYAERYATGGALLLLDLDGFKRVNDTKGHGAGDDLLRSVSAALRANLRTSDVLARLAGDEFAVLIPNADRPQAEAAARNLVGTVRDFASASVGVVHLDDADGSANAAFAHAEAALRAAKDAGRDRAVLYTAGMSAPAADWEVAIDRALREGGFCLYLQPILDLADGSCTRHEALLRMRRDGEIVAPGEFLGAAERSGQIHQIDRWVVCEAIRMLAERPDLELEVNLSGRSLDDESLLSVIADELRHSGTDPERLILEITETATIANMQEARRLAESLADLGCRFAIDDFGTGFGSFSYLKHLPAAFLKIDGEFVASPRSRTDELVIEAIVGMARGLGKQTIAEFVGDEETVEMLRAAGVDYAQGYHVGRPFPASDLPPAA